MEKDVRATSLSTVSPTPRAVVPVDISFQVNGAWRSLSLDPRTSLLDVLRDVLELTGTKKGCDQGACGACTVLVDGTRTLSCLMLGVQCDGCDVTTIEGIDVHEVGRLLQAAFIEHDGFQCGYCTPGQICSAVGMLDELSRGDLVALLRECRAADEDGARLVEAYLDRVHPDWRDELGGDAGPRQAAASPDVTVEEAYAILGLEPGADAAAIKAAHHRLMMQLHPDHGGTDYLATKINRARDVLLNH